MDHHHRKFGSDGYKHDTLISKTYDDYDNNVSYDSNGQDKSENFSKVSQVQHQDYEDEEVFLLQDDDSIVRDTSDWGLHDS